jgi:cystathionine gamma-synthase
MMPPQATEEKLHPMTTVTILSKEPPGGRCSLYMRYAEALRQALGFQPEVRYCDSSAAVPPPAMLVGDVLVTPSDGVIVSPEDIALSLSDHLGEAEVAELRQVLEATQEQWMEEWSHA